MILPKSESSLTSSASIGGSSTSWYGSVAWLLILSCLAAQGSRIASSVSKTGETPFFSANDRSRWCTVASLVEFGTYQIDDVLFRTDPKTKRRVWYSIDLVRHRGSDGKQHYYSSKPPLLATMVAGVYWCVRSVIGQNILDQPFYSARVTLGIVNLIPLAVYFLVLSRLIQRWTNDPWCRLFLLVGLLGGTFVTTFANTLNNHLPAAICVGIGLDALTRVLIEKDARSRWFAVLGFSSAFAVTCDLPALSWLGMCGLVMLSIDIKKTIIAAAPPILLVAGAFFGTTYWAHQDLRPPYAHRDVGAALFQYKANQASTADLQKLLPGIKAELAQRGWTLSNQTKVLPARRPQTWEIWDESNQYRFAIVVSETATVIHHWDDWYDYPKSYWLPENKAGVDKGEPSQLVYLFHSTFGHRGLFSLTPMWLLAVFGAFLWVKHGDRENRILSVSIILPTVVCLAFYMLRPQEDRNYGGVCSGFRWMFWFTPLWFYLMVPALERVVRTPWTRGLASVMLAVSVFSASFPWPNPWTQPWIFQFWEYLGWIKY